MRFVRKHPIYALFALFGLLLSSLVVSAADSTAAVTGGPTLPYWVGTPNVCINDHTQGSGIPFFTAGAQWNNNAAIDIKHESQVGGDCTGAGYPLGRQIEVFLVDSEEPGCYHWFVTATPPDDNGRRWRTRTIAYLHANKLWCWSTANRKANRASKMIGGFLGAANIDNSTVSVMGPTYDTVPYPIAYDHDTINDHYWFWRKV